MDRGQKDTDKILSEVEKRINEEYKQAIEGIEAELSDYLRRFETKDKIWRGWVEDGKKTDEEYQQWRIGQMAVGKRWSDLQESLAQGLYETDKTARNYVKDACPEIFAENYNFSAYEIEKQVGVNTAFTLYSKESVERLAKDNPEVLPPVGKKVAKDIAEGKAVKWNKQQLQSVMMQGILQGDSIPKLATRLANTVGDRDRKATIRNARTMATGAQNAGRIESYKNAKNMGIDLEQMWIATMDNRTRHSHRWLDGETKPVGEAFSNGCKFPGDPAGRPEEIYNCRCTLRGVVKGLERRSGLSRDTSAVDGMTYDEWRNAKAVSNPITLPEEKAESIKRRYQSEYAGGKHIKSAGYNNSISVGNSSTNNTLSYTPAQTIQEAKQYAKDTLGIELNNFDKANLDFVNRLNGEITKVYNEFGDLHNLGVLDSSYIINKKVPYEAAYVPSLNQLTFRSGVANAKNGLKSMKKTAEACFDAGYWSSNAAEHSFRHELGHTIEKAIKGNNAVDAELTAIREKIKAAYNITDITESFYDAQGNLTDDYYKCKAVGKDFSYYGLTDNGELIAEAFAEYMNGNPRSYAKQIIDAVKKGL